MTTCTVFTPVHFDNASCLRNGMSGTEMRPNRKQLLLKPLSVLTPRTAVDSHSILISTSVIKKLNQAITCSGNPQNRRCSILPCISANVASSSETVAADENGSSQNFSKKHLEDFLLYMQEKICSEAAAADGSGKEFLRDKWQRGEDESAGYGITRVLEGGDLLEKAAANISIVRGNLSAARAQAMSARGRGVKAGAPYFAGALSLVFHPRNPYVPTFRSDVRYFEVEGLPGWFGGGADLTPCYLFEEDAKSFHSFYQSICDRHDPNLYQESKKLCNKYFYIPARKEHRGVGGIFFDDLVDFGGNRASSSSTERAVGARDEGPESDRGSDEVYSFVRDVCEGFMPSYLPIAKVRRERSYTDHERQWQLVRRGRYLEFNLLYDRGVRFGLDGGRIESIMVSAPPLIAWKYMVIPEEGSPEATLLEVLKTPRDW